MSTQTKKNYLIIHNPMFLTNGDMIKIRRSSNGKRHIASKEHEKD